MGIKIRSRVGGGGGGVFRVKGRRRGLCCGENYGLRREEEGWRERFDAGAVEGEGKVELRMRDEDGEAIGLSVLLLMLKAEADVGTEARGGCVIAALAAKEGDTNMPRGATAAAANGAAAAGVFTAAVDENETAPATAAGRGVPAAEETFSAAAVRFPVN